MLASSPASMVNQKRLDLGIPNRFKVSSSRFNAARRATAPTRMPRQHPPGETPAKAVTGFDVQVVEGITAEQSAVEGTPACDAVVLGACIARLAVSPGNCTAA